MIAAYWHHRTTKGGGKYNRSKVLPFARWITRVMLWRTGVAQQFFMEQEAQDLHNNDSDSDSDASE